MFRKELYILIDFELDVKESQSCHKATPRPSRVSQAVSTHFTPWARNETGNVEDSFETPDATMHINESVVAPTPTPEATSSGLFYFQLRF